MGFKDAWQRAGEPADDFDPPDGTYQVRITDASAFAGNDSREWGKVRLHVTHGPHQGREFDDFMNFNNEVGFRIARQNLAVYGLSDDGTITDLEDLNTAMLELIGHTATVTVKHSVQGYVNVTVQQSRTGQSDIPTDQTAFDVGDTPQPVGARRYGQPDTDDDDLPY